METNLIILAVIAVLVVIYLILKKSQHREDILPMVSEPNPPAVSEDVNLPAPTGLPQKDGMEDDRTQ